MYVKLVDLWDQKGTIYTDQTGNLPVRARSGNRFIMVMVAIDSNAILVTPVRDHIAKTLAGVNFYTLALSDCDRSSVHGTLLATPAS